MPIAPLPTLQAADAINQFPQPDRMNVGPDQHAAPTPLPGTGQVEVGTGSFSRDYTSQVLGTKDKNDPGHLAMYSGQDVYNPRYTSVLPGEDSEEAFAKGQSAWNKWGNALVKMGATAVGTFFNGMTAIPDTISAIKNGENPYETAQGTGIDRWLKNLEDEFPNYYTKWEQQHPFLSALPFSGGSSNFWSDKFLKNLGFTIGAIGGAAVQDAIVGTITGGLGDIPLIGNQIGKAALYLNKLFTGSDKVGELLQLGRDAGRTEQQLLSLKDLARAAAATRVSDGVRFATNLYGAAASESGFEGRSGYRTVKEDLTDDYIKTHGYAPIDKEADDIEKAATASANVRFGVNLALLGVSDAIQFDALLKPFSAARAGYRGTLQREIEEGVGTVGLKKGSLDEFERVKAATRMGRVWDKIHPHVPALISEGIYEEGGQYGAQIGTQNYYERKYLFDKGLNKSLYKADTSDFDARDDINNILHSVGNGIGAEFGTQEGLENIFLGGLTGLFSSGVEHFLDRKENIEHRKEILDLLNKNGVTGSIKNMYEATVAAHRITSDMKQAAADGDIFKYKNFQHEAFVNFITSGIKAGRFDLRIAQLDLLKDMDEAAFKQAFGIDKTEENKRTVTEYVDKLKNKAEEIKRTYNLIDENFNNPYKYNKKAKTEDYHIQNEKYQEFQGWKEQLTYWASINKDAEGRKESIDRQIRQISPSITSEQVRALTNPSDLREYENDLTKRAKTIEDGLKSDLSVDRVRDAKLLKLLNERAAQIRELLNLPPDKVAEALKGTAKKMFEDLLNFQLNGESEETSIQAPKAGITELMKMGEDINKINAYKALANHAFDILSSKKGFEKYFSDIKAAKDKANAAQQEAEKAKQSAPQAAPTTPIVGQVTPIPAPVKVPVEPRVINITNKDGKKTEYDLDKEYFIDTGEGLEPVKIIDQNPQGVTVQKSDGTKIVVPLADFFAQDSLGAQLNEAQEGATTIEDVPPPTLDNQGTPANKRGESKKDLAWGTQATTDPPYDVKTTPDDNYQRRHQNFLFNMGSRDPKVFNQESKKYLRIIPVTPKTQASLGLSGWIKEEDNDVDNTPIRAVYILDFRDNTDLPVDDRRIYYVSGKGEPMTGISADYQADPTKLIYTNMASTDLQYGEGGAREDRYTNKEGLDPEKVVAWWRQQRSSLLSRDTIKDWPIYQFEISRGIPNISDPNVRNSIVDTGLVREEDLDKPIIEVLTLGNVAISGALNDEGEGIAAHRTSVNMGDMGKQVFNFGGNMGYLDPRKLSTSEAKNLFDLIKLVSYRETTDKTGIFNYLRKVVYMPNTKAGKTATEGSIIIQGSNLFLGKAKTPILMNPQNVENNKDKIVAFLEGTFHNISNSELLRIAKNPKANDLAFNELRVRDDKVEVARVWRNYNHYLASNKYPDGSRRNNMVLSTKIVKPQEGEVPIIQKYSVIKGPQMDTKMMASEAPSETTIEQLKALGWSDEKIAKMTPKQVDIILKKGISAEENTKMAEKARQEQGIKVETPPPAPIVTPTPPPAQQETPEEYQRALQEIRDKLAALDKEFKEKGDSFRDEYIRRKEELDNQHYEATFGPREEEPPFEPDRVVETIQIEDVKFAVTDIVRDNKGNITDFTVQGKMDEEGNVSTPKDAAGLKAALLARIRKSQLKEDSSTNPEEKKSLRERLANKNRKKGPDSQYRIAPITNPGSYTKGDQTKELAEAQLMLPGVPMHLVDKLIRRTGGGFAWGALEEGMIYVYKNAEVGTSYHEAFEAVWGHFLNGKEQRELYNELIGREGTFRTYEGTTKPFSQATVKEAKEQIAEEFRDYKMQAKPTPRTAIERFFQRLLDFIRRFIFGDKSKINQVFKKLNRGDYRGIPTSLRSMEGPQYSRPQLGDMSEAMIQDVLQGMTVEMFMDIFRDNQDIIVQLEENPERGSQELYTKLKEKLTNYFEDEDSGIGDTLEGEYAGDGGEKWNAMTPEEQEIALNQIDAIREQWGKVKDKWDVFVKEHKTYLKVFNVEFIVDDEGNLGFADDEYHDEDGKSQSDFGQDHMLVDAKNAASPKIKLLIATIADSYWRTAARDSIEAARTDETVINRNNSELKMAKQAAYAKLFNYLLHNMSNINGIYDMWGKMEEMIKDPSKRKKIDANLSRVMTRMSFKNGFKEKTIAQIKMILALENTLSKQKPGFFRQFVDTGRKTFFKTSTLNSKLSQIKTLWTAGMMASKSVTSTSDGRFKFSKDLIGVTDNIKFLNKLGIPIEQAEYDRLKGKDLNRFNSSVNKIRGVVETAANNDLYIPVMSPREIDFNSRVDEIAEIYISNITGDDSQSQHSNLDNEATSNFVLNNFVSTVLADANNSATRREFMDRIDNGYFNDVFHADSILLTKLLFEDTPEGKKTKNQIEIGVVEGRQSWNGDNRSAATLTEAERQLYEYNNNVNGVFYTLLPADAKTEWAINVGTYLSVPGFFGDEYSRREEINKFAAQMYTWLQTEINLAKDYLKPDSPRKNISALNRTIGERAVGASLRFFGDLLEKDIVDKITKQVIDGEAKLQAIYTEPELRARLNDVVLAKARSSMDNLVDWSLIDYTEKDNTYKLNGFDNTFLKSAFGDKEEYNEGEVIRLMAFREMNYIMNNIEMHKFFFGDPAQYKDELKRIKSFLSGREATHIDTIGTDQGLNSVLNDTLNRTKEVGGVQLKIGDPGYHQFKNHFVTMTIRDVKYHSSQIEAIEKAIGKERAKPYRSGDEADAQAYMMNTAYREALTKAGGRFTSAQEKQFQWEMAWERQDKAKDGLYQYTDKELEKADKETLKEPENTEVYFPVLKLVHSGIQYEEGVAIASLDKASWAPLFYRWYKGTTIGKLYDMMQDQGVDYSRMESAHKVGVQANSTVDMYDKDGEFNRAAMDDAYGEFISLKHLGIQVEQTKKEKGQTEGSQARKIATSDLRSNGVPIDYKGWNTEDGFVAWNALTNEQKLAASPIYAKIQRHDTVLRRLTEARTEQTMNRLGIVKKGDGYTVPDKKKVSDFILDELQRRELPRNIAYGLEVVYGKDGKTSDFVQPLEANAQYTKIRSIIYSVMEKTIMRPKVSGGQKTMLSVTGFEKGKRVTKETVNGKPVYTSDTLQFYTVGKDGTQACEVMLPYWFGKQLSAMGSKRNKEEVLKYLNETEEGKKLLTGIGFRIPTQGLNSIDFFVIKDFLPEQMGDVIVLPSEITAKAGSDFDIDKLNTYLRNFYVDNRTGYPIAVKWQGSPAATKEYIDKLLDSGSILSAKEAKELDRYIAEEKDYAYEIGEDDLTMKFPGVASLFEDGRITRDFLKNRRQIMMNKVYMQALENEYFDAMEDLLKLPENYNKLIQPNDATQLKDDRTWIKGLIAKRDGVEENTLGNYGKLLDSQFMMKERHAYLMSKGIVGPSAVSQTAHAVSQNLDGGLVVVDPEIEARFPHNTIGGRISLSSLTLSGSDQYISNVNAQTTDGGVDVAKDKFLAEMGINKDTLTTYLTMIRMGAPRRWAALFINQPAIQSFLKVKAIHDSVSQVNTRIHKKSPWELSSMVYNEYGYELRSKKAVKEFMQGKPKRYTMEEMEGAITSKVLTPSQKRIQLMMLDDYQKYNSLAWDLFHFYQGYNWDTARLNDPNEVRFKELKYLKANNELVGQKPPSISRVAKVMNQFIGAMRENTLRLDTGLRSLINVQSGAAGSVLRDIAKDIFNQGGLNAYERNQIMLNSETSMVDYAVQTGGQVKGKPITSYIFPLLMGSKSIARYVQAIKESQDPKLVNNPFVKNLVALIDKRKDWPSTIQLEERDYDTYTSNVWTDGFRELKNDTTVISINDNPDDDRTVAQIYENLVLGAILQSGSKKTSTSLSHLIPNESYSERTRDSLRNMKMEGFYENNVMYRTNWMNDKLVPIVEAYEDEYQPGEFYYPFFPGKEGNIVKNLQEQLGGERAAGILTVPAWKYKNNKVIKIKETYDQDTGQRLAIPTVLLFERVDIQDIEGVQPLTLEGLPQNIFFKGINAWGDGNRIQEYHEGTTQSILPNNLKVNEVTNDQLLYAFHKGGYKLNIADETVEGAVRRIIGDNGSDTDEMGNEEPPTPPTPPDPITDLFGPVEKSPEKSEYTNHSGGAIGSDSEWDKTGREFGVKDQRHYYHGAKTPIGNIEITSSELEEGWRHVLEANKTLNRKPEAYKSLLSRNWMQVKNADEVFAIAKKVDIKPDRSKPLGENVEDKSRQSFATIVDGGTGWAVQMAIDAKKTVHVFDQSRKEWLVSRDGDKILRPEETPTLTKDFAGIGTREIDESGKKAIRSVYEKTFHVDSSPTSSEIEPEDRLDECGGTGFSVKNQE